MCVRMLMPFLNKINEQDFAAMSANKKNTIQMLYFGLKIILHGTSLRFGFFTSFFQN